MLKQCNCQKHKKGLLDKDLKDPTHLHKSIKTEQSSSDCTDCACDPGIPENPPRERGSGKAYLENSNFKTNDKSNVDKQNLMKTLYAYTDDEKYAKPLAESSDFDSDEEEFKDVD